MTEQPDIDAKIGEAWKAHYNGDNNAAITKFLELTNLAPDSVDAYWGLGLSYRNAGDKESAVEAFSHAKALLAHYLEVESEYPERYMMLSRMVDQQITQISDFLL